MAPTISARTLEQLHACSPQVALFRETFGEGEVTVTLKLAVDHASLFNWEWAAITLLHSPGAWGAFERAMAAADEAYDCATTAADEAYDCATAAAKEAYDRATAAAKEAYDRASATAWAAAFLSQWECSTMTTTTYTVLNRHGVIQCEHATLSKAARAVLQYDGHEYDIRRSGVTRGFWLYVSQFSRNSPCGGRPLVRRHYVVADTEAEAKAKIFHYVIDHAEFWHGLTVLTDEAYAELLADLSELGE